MNLLLMNVPERMETERLVFQCPKASYGAELYDAILDGYEEKVQWLNWPPTPPSREAVEIECRQHQAEFILRQFIRYLVIEKHSNKVIGRCGFPPFQTFWSIPQFGLSYFIRQSAAGQGMGTEVAHALSLLAFQGFKAKKVEICVDAENIASKRIPEKLNFKLECQKKGGWPRLDGELATLLTFYIFSSADLPSNFYLKTY